MEENLSIYKVESSPGEIEHCNVKPRRKVHENKPTPRVLAPRLL